MATGLGLATAASLALASLAGPVSADPAFTVSVDMNNLSYSHGFSQDAPLYAVIGQDGQFHGQASSSMYEATGSHTWQFWKGTDLDYAPADATRTNSNTVALCENSPTGQTASYDPKPNGYAYKNYCDLMGVYIDPDSGNWYGLVHNEFTPNPFGAGTSHFDSIDSARSTDGGKTWTITGHAITSPYSTARNDTVAFPNNTYYYGDGDPRLVIDYKSGWAYVYYTSRVVSTKGGGWLNKEAHVARAQILSNLSPGSFTKWYEGSWSQPGIGGKESDLVPVSTNSNGWLPTASDYNPATDNVPASSPLAAMNVSYNAYLGRYIGTPEIEDQSVPRPHQIYATASLDNPKWELIGDTGSYTSASWYRWIADSISNSTSTIVGKTFKQWCTFYCYAPGATTNDELRYNGIASITVSSAQPAHVIDTSRTYKIGSGSNLLAQSGTTATTSTITSTGTQWKFAETGDGAYTVTNVASNQRLGVSSAAGTASRAWGTVPTVTGADSKATHGQQQWWLVQTAWGWNLINRYSGLPLALQAPGTTKPAQLTPWRNWNAPSTGPTAGLKWSDVALTLSAS